MKILILFIALTSPCLTIPIPEDFLSRFFPLQGQPEVHSSSYSYENVVVSHSFSSENDNDGSERGFSEVKVSVVQKDQDVKSALDYGIQEIGDLIGTDNLKIVKINGVWEKQSDKARYYRFELDLSDDTGATIKVSFTIKDNGEAQEREIQQYNYYYERKSSHVDKDPKNDNRIVLLATPPDAEAQGALDFGIEQLVREINKKKHISDIHFELFSMNSAQKITTKDTVSYKFNVELVNSEDDIIDALFEVSINTRTGEKRLKSFSYSYDDDMRDLNILSHPTYELPSDLEDFKDTNINEALSDPLIKSCLDLGIKKIIDKALEDRKISSDDCELTQISSVQKAVRKESTAYKFVVELDTKQGDKLTATFAAVYYPKTGQKTIESFYYTVTSTKVNQSSGDSPSKAALKVDVEKDKIAKKALDYGVGQVREIVARQGLIEGGDLEVKKINGADVREGKEGKLFVFEIELEGEDMTLSVVVEVYWDSGNGECRLKSFKLSGSSSTSIEVVRSGYGEKLAVAT